MIAFEADTEDELAFQAPPAEAVIDDDDDWENSQASSPEASANSEAEIGDEETGVAPLHARLAQFS